MTDWLSEFEQLDHDAVVLKPGWIYKNMLLMARVLRELAKELKSAYGFIDTAREELPHEKYDAEATLQAGQDIRGEKLSDDAKELLI